MSNQKFTDMVMPQLAESLVSATIAKWLKQPGDKVEQYEPICEVITDKVNAEIPSTVDGIMGEWVAEEGQTVAVGEVICRIAAAGAAGAPAEERPQAEPRTTPAPVQPEASGDQSMRGRYSPAVQSLAAEHGVNLSAV
ncbi:biotin/lipoyl-containing protein, partial [Paenibacillus sp. AR247]